MFKFVVLAFALVGFMFACTVVVCFVGYSRACVIDLMPTGGDMMCTKQPRVNSK